MKHLLISIALRHRRRARTAAPRATCALAILLAACCAMFPHPAWAQEQDQAPTPAPPPGATNTPTPGATERPCESEPYCPEVNAEGAGLRLLWDEWCMLRSRVPTNNAGIGDGTGGFPQLDGGNHYVWRETQYVGTSANLTFERLFVTERRVRDNRFILYTYGFELKQRLSSKPAWQRMGIYAVKPSWFNRSYGHIDTTMASYMYLPFPKYSPGVGLSSPRIEFGTAQHVYDSNKTRISLHLRLDEGSACRIKNMGAVGSCTYGLNHPITWEGIYQINSAAGGEFDQAMYCSNGYRMTWAVRLQDYSPIDYAKHGLNSNVHAHPADLIYIHTLGHHYYYWSCVNNCLEYCMPNGNPNCPAGCVDQYPLRWCNSDNRVRWTLLSDSIEDGGVDVFDPDKKDEYGPDNDPHEDVFDICMGDVPNTPCGDGRDFGDAPGRPGYHVTGSNAASHGGFTPYLGLARLGLIRDSELVGNPSADAKGDDDQRYDDEDGITTTPLVDPSSLLEACTVAPLGYQNRLYLQFQESKSYIETAMSIVGAVWPFSNDWYLRVWADWNDDGDWDEPNELVSAGRYGRSGTGLTYHRLPIAYVPCSTAPGEVAVRMRLATDANVQPSGPADGGEVEDYILPVAAAFPTCPNKTGGLATPIVMLHGFSPVGSSADCEVTFGRLKRDLRAAGWSGLLITLGWYNDSVNCDAKLTDNLHANPPPGTGSVYPRPGKDSQNQLFNQETSLYQVSYQLAWWLHDTFGGSSFNIVTHSTGAIVARRALYEVQGRHHPQFPTSLHVDRVLTAGGPHGGVTLGQVAYITTILNGQRFGDLFNGPHLDSPLLEGWIGELGCVSLKEYFPTENPGVMNFLSVILNSNYYTQQCTDLRPGSAFLQEMNDFPTKTHEGRWILVGAMGDAVIEPNSATGLVNADERIKLLQSTQVRPGGMTVRHSHYHTTDMQPPPDPIPQLVYYFADDHCANTEAVEFIGGKRSTRFRSNRVTDAPHTNWLSSDALAGSN